MNDDDWLRGKVHDPRRRDRGKVVDAVNALCIALIGACMEAAVFWPGRPPGWLPAFPVGIALGHAAFVLIYGRRR